MPREFGKYNPQIPLGVDWEDSFTLIGDDGQPVDLTGYDVHAQIRRVLPQLVNMVANVDPLFEITTPSFYTTSPAWPVVEGFRIPDPVTGQIFLHVPALDTYKGSPTNVIQETVWDIRLVGRGTGYVIPVVKGDKLTFVPGATVP